jgi:putative FmdB family regulatory protein
MPTYEYECTRGCQFEVQQSIKDDAFPTCRKEFCPQGRSGTKLRRLISASRFILKGSGWYSDGYSSKGGGSSSSSGGSSDSSSSAGSSSGKDSGSGGGKSNSGGGKSDSGGKGGKSSAAA